MNLDEYGKAIAMHNCLFKKIGMTTCSTKCNYFLTLIVFTSGRLETF